MPEAADLGMPGLARVLAAADEAVTTAEGAELGAAHRFRFAARLRAGDGPALEHEREAVLALAAVNTIAWTDVQLVAAALALLAGRFADGQRLAREQPDSPDAIALLAAAAFWTGDVDALDALRAVDGADRPVRLVGELSVIAALGGEAISRLRADDSRPTTSPIPLRARTALRILRTRRPPRWRSTPGTGSQHSNPSCAGTRASCSSRQWGWLRLMSPIPYVVPCSSALGRHNDALACFETAAHTCTRAGAVVHSMVNEHRHARAWVRRNAAGDRARAAVLARDAFGRASRLGMPDDARLARSVLQTLDFEVDL